MTAPLSTRLTDGLSTGSVAVVTVVHGRAAHLRAQGASLLAGTRVPDHWVLVAMDDPEVVAWRPDPGEALTPDVVELPADPRGLPLAAARNAGVRRAVELGAEVLVLLDVDVLAGAGLVAAYADAVGAVSPDGHDGPDGPGRLWCGPVTYLPPAPADGYALDTLPALDAPHPARPAPAPGEWVEATTERDWDLFWSLSFALRAADWARTGGFHEAYVGYGGEDTDFARLARAAGLRLTWLGGARGYHQHHPVSRPPVEHLDDIVRNARIFHERWGTWPMSGWLEAFAEEGLLTRTHDDWVPA